MKINAINTNFNANFNGTKKQQRLSIKQLETEYPTKTLSEVKFRNGVAKDKRKNYTGIVKDSLEENKDFTFYFQNGRLIASQFGDIKKLYFRKDDNSIDSIDTKNTKTKESGTMYPYKDSIIVNHRKPLAADYYISEDKTTYIKDTNGLRKTKKFIYNSSDLKAFSTTIVTIENKQAKKIEITKFKNNNRETTTYYMEKDKNGNIISIITPAKDGKFYEIDHIEIKRKPNGEIKGIKRTNNAPDDVLLDFSLKHPKVFKGWLCHNKWLIFDEK